MQLMALLFIVHYSLYNMPAMRSLRQNLLDTDLARLQIIARFWDVELTASRQRDAAAQLAEAMAAPEAIAHVWETLPDDQRRALETVLAAGGRKPRRIFARQWGEIRAMGPGRMERERPWREPISPAEGLWYKGLIYHIFEPGPDGAYEVVFVPPELRVHLPAPDMSPSTIILDPVPAPAAVRSDDDALLDDACTLLAYLQNERLRPDPDGGWPRRHETRLIRRLRDPAPERLIFLRHLAHRLAWLRVTDASLMRPDPEPVTAWLQSSTEQQRDALAKAWRDDPTWNELFHIPALHPEETGAWRSDPLLARKAILRHLAACAPDAWYKLDDLVTAIKQTDPDFQRPDGDYTSWYIRDVISGVYLSGFESWDAVEGMLIRHVITGPLAWFGLIDWGESDVFRITAAGAAFLDLDELPPAPEPAPLTLRPDFTVLAPPARRYERFQLARVADYVTSPPAGGTEGGDAPFIYRITPSSLEHAQQQGIGVARVIEFLERVSDAPVPRPIEAALTRWEAHGTEARLERAILLRLSGEELMTQVTSSPRARRLVHEQVGPTAALVRERDWPRLVVALGEMGLLPDIIALEEDQM
jgi:hypothetical protein